MIMERKVWNKPQLTVQISVCKPRDSSTADKAQINALQLPADVPAAKMTPTPQRAMNFTCMTTSAL